MHDDAGFPVLTAHIQLRKDCCDMQHWHQCLRQMQDMLCERFEIEHATLQIEPEGYEKDRRRF